MKPKNDIDKLIKKLQKKASADLDRRVHDDISRALAEPEETEPAVIQFNMFRYVTKGGTLKLAAAAGVIFAFGVGLAVGRWSKPAQPAPQMFDVTGYASAVSAYSTAPEPADGFWQQKARAMMQHRLYVQQPLSTRSLLDAYKQYLKEKYNG